MTQHALQRVAILFSLIAGSLLPAGADSWDPSDDAYTTATLLPAPATSNQTHGVHTLTEGLDEADWFKVQLNAGTAYIFEAAGDSDTEGFLYADPEAPEVLFNADDGEEGLNFLLSYTPQTSGIYYLKVEEWFFGDAEYSLNYRIATDGWDPADDTGSGALLRAMDERSYTEYAHYLAGGDLADWYTFELAADNTYRFESYGDWDVAATLYSDAAGTAQLAVDDNSGFNKNFQLDFTPFSSGTYYLKIEQGSNPVDFAKYSITYALFMDEWDSGDDVRSGATLLGQIDETVRSHGPHALSDLDISDWFKVHLSVGNTYIFQSTGASDTEAYLYGGPAGNELKAYNDDFQPVEVSSNFKISFTPVSSGNYYLRIKSSTGGNESIYNLLYHTENDLDGDGLLDGWERDFLNSTNAVPGDDPDGDLFSNLDEYIAGTDPTNPASYFAITNGSVGSFIVEWPSIEGREYEVIWTDSLTNSFQSLEAGIDYPQNSYTDTAHSAESAGYYKIKVMLK